ncbi:unnamed protein product [Leptidea sinapis]|uniref:Endonuclease/exonuclease/phosphatase domain-containing protein n=1 Tax=Leptidea sinapis TaxID=189913 RepID=A0A5E4R0T4_9NEOP|nr:unnamed protein product [Leptidea sinapis]
MNSSILKQEDLLERVTKAFTNYRHLDLIGSVDKGKKSEISYFKDDLYSDFDDTYIDYKTRMKEDMRKLQINTGGSGVTGAATTAVLNTDVKLPQIQLPRFSDTSTWDPIVNYLVLTRLDSETRKVWELQVSQNESEALPTWAQLRNFLETRFRTLEMWYSGKPVPKSFKNSPIKKVFHAAVDEKIVNNHNEKERVCVIRLLDDADRHGYQVLGPEVPTHYQYCAAHMPDVLDIAVTCGLAAAPSLDVLDDHLISDHQAVLLTLKTTPMTTSLPSPKHRQDWRIFAEHMAEHKVSNALRESRLDAASTRRQPQLPAYIQAMIEEKRKLRRQWQNLRCPTMKTRLNALAVKISDALETVADESCHSAIERAGDDWSGMHRLCRQLSGKPSPIRPLMASDGTPRYRAEDRAEIFADYLETQFTPNPTADVQHVETIERHVKNYFESPIVPTEDPVVFSPGQVQRMIRRTRLRKAPGPDRFRFIKALEILLGACLISTRYFINHEKVS